MNAGNLPPHALIVEGRDDRYAAQHIWNRHAGAFSLSVSEKDGVQNLLNSIRNEVRVPGRRVVGIIVDADDDPIARWRAVSDRLREVNIQTPNSPDPDGTIIEARGGYPRVGIWLMPDNASAGELEDFIAEMIPDGDPVWPLSANYIDGIPAPHRKFSANKETRAKVHAWLAARKDPRPMGQAIGARDLGIGGALCGRFVRWLDNLMR